MGIEKQIKILLITSSFPVDDHIAGVHIPDLTEHLSQRGCEVHILTQNCQANATVTRPLPGGNSITYFGWSGQRMALVNTLRGGFRGLRLALQYLFNGVLTARGIARSWRPDVIHAEWVIPSGLIAWVVSILTGIPFTTRALGSDVLVAGRKKVIRRMLEVITRRAAVLFADGFELCEITSRLAGGKPCYFAATSRQLEQTTSGFRPLDDSGFLTTCTVGRLHPTKGQDTLLQAVKLLVARGVPVRAYIVGAGEEFARLQQEIRTLGLADHAILTGRLEDGDIDRLLRHVDGVVIPSRSESIPLVLREAVAVGKPLVVTDVGDMGTLVRQYELGEVVPPGEPEPMADAIGRMLNGRKEIKSDQAAALVKLLSTETAAATMLERIDERLHPVREQGNPSVQGNQK